MPGERLPFRVRQLSSMLRLARRLEPAKCYRLKIPEPNAYSRFISSAIPRQHDPLNILFCGADEFSIYSLRALRNLQDSKSGKIAGINVVCKPDKYVGRGLKQVQEVPIKIVAKQLGLNLHQIDTFKGWSPPNSINLVVAVSFGLLVPARILHGAKYGGLNVHPSMLPDLRGPAPILHTLLKQRSHTGVTLQSMHPTRFDHGMILSQTHTPGVPVPKACTPDELLKVVGPLGAQMLCRGIEEGLFVPPLKDVRTGTPEPEQLDHAPKVTSEDRHIDWNTWTADEIIRRDRVLGRLWDNETYQRCSTSVSKRVTFHGPWTKASKHTTESYTTQSYTPGQPMSVNVENSKAVKLGIRMCDQQVVIPSAATIDGEKKGTGLVALINHLGGA